MPDFARIGDKVIDTDRIVYVDTVGFGSAPPHTYIFNVHLEGGSFVYSVETYASADEALNGFRDTLGYPSI